MKKKRTKDISTTKEEVTVPGGYGSVLERRDVDHSVSLQLSPTMRQLPLPWPARYASPHIPRPTSNCSQWLFRRNSPSLIEMISVFSWLVLQRAHRLEKRHSTLQAGHDKPCARALQVKRTPVEQVAVHDPLSRFPRFRTLASRISSTASGRTLTTDHCTHDRVPLG